MRFVWVKVWCHLHQRSSMLCCRQFDCGPFCPFMRWKGRLTDWLASWWTKWCVDALGLWLFDGCMDKLIDFDLCLFWDHLSIQASMPHDGILHLVALPWHVSDKVSLMAVHSASQSVSQLVYSDRLTIRQSVHQQLINNYSLSRGCCMLNFAYPDFENSLIDESSHSSSCQRSHPKDPVPMESSAHHCRPKASCGVHTTKKEALFL